MVTTGRTGSHRSLKPSDIDVSAILDGEIVVVEDVRTNFSLLQADLATGRKDRMALYLFDILFLDGRDLRSARLVERKAVLEGICRLRAPRPETQRAFFKRSSAA